MSLTHLKEFINAVSSPVTIFTAAAALFALFVAFPRVMTAPRVAIPAALGGIAFFIFGLTDEHFRKIVGTPDNVPIVGMIFIFAYFTWYAMRKAVVNDMRMERGEPTVEKLESDEKVLVFPYLIFIELVAALAFSAGLILWAIFLRAPLEQPANPTVSPNPSKAPWYFLGLQEMLVYFDPWIAGVLLPTLIIVGLCAIPYLDRDPSTSGYYSFKGRRGPITAYLFGFWILWILLIIMGTFLRGPNWNFFGPFETWDVHKVVPLLNVNLSELVFIKWLGWGFPKNVLLRESPGILLIGLYFIAAPMILAKTLLKNAYKKTGAIRYGLLAILLLMMASLPIKMYLRWAFNLKYLVAFPEFFFNI